MSYVFQCFCYTPKVIISKPNAEQEDAETKITQLLEGGTASTIGKILEKKPKKRNEVNEVLEALDLFKGILVIFMTYSHVNLVLVNPADAQYSKLGHFIGNIASAMCYLGFMFAYGFVCDCMYISNYKPRPFVDLCTRVMRSICLPMLGALICSFAWTFLCFKFPINFEMVASLLTFYNLVGNGPDFILSFATMMVIMFPLREIINYYWDNGKMVQRELLMTLLLLIPLGFTFIHIENCMGNRKYLNIFFECTIREPWSANLCALPHLFYFNSGLIAARLVREYGIQSFTSIGAVTCGMFFAILSIPLYSVWDQNYGNLMVETPFGMVTRGFTNGPSVWWIVGNIFSIFCLLQASWYFHQSKRLQWLNEELQHLGANILLYLVVADIILAGSYRASITPEDAFPLMVFPGGFLVTAGIIGGTRFLHYLGHSSRK